LFAAGNPGHFIQENLIFNDIPVVNGSSLFLEGLTGLYGIGSTEFSIDDDFVHKNLLERQNVERSTQKTE